LLRRADDISSNRLYLKDQRSPDDF
jgi:hypothetical protein